MSRLDGVDSLAAMWRRWGGSLLRETLLVLVVTLLTVYGTYGEAHPTNPNDQKANGHLIPHAPAGAIALVAVGSLVLAFRRRYPIQTLCVSMAAVAAFSLLGYENGAAVLAPAVALYAVTSTASVRRAVAWTAITMVIMLGATAARNPFGPVGGAFFAIPAVFVAALAAGLAVASRRAYVSSIESRADDAAQRRIDAERLRIARELHDVVAHTMATINVQAGAAIHVAAERPEAAIDALRIIRGASKDGLRELRAILNVLRQADEAEAQFPAPGLSQAGTLMNSARAAGLPVTLTVTGQTRALPAEVDLAAYRIVQESLTNAIRHAGPATATVSLSYTEHDLEIEIADDGLGSPANGAAPNSGGHGLPGMRERAATVGGSLQAGPVPGGGFRVFARLPIRDNASSQPPDRAPAGNSTEQRLS
jgi:signal transduction histidine kinase